MPSGTPTRGAAPKIQVQSWHLLLDERSANKTLNSPHNPHQGCWDLSVVVYAHTEAFLSVHHLRQATDAYDLTDAALRSYAWWWCYDLEMGVASLREIANTW